MAVVTPQPTSGSPSPQDALFETLRSSHRRPPSFTEDATDFPVFDSLESPLVSLRGAVTEVQADV